jgi:hypothetical protein
LSIWLFINLTINLSEKAVQHFETSSVEALLHENQK